MNTGCRGWDRTSASAGQSRMPYRLATRHYIRGLASPLHVPALYYILLYLRFFSDDSTSLGPFSLMKLVRWDLNPHLPEPQSGALPIKLPTKQWRQSH